MTEQILSLKTQIVVESHDKMKEVGTTNETTNELIMNIKYAKADKTSKRLIFQTKKWRIRPITNNEPSFKLLGVGNPSAKAISLLVKGEKATADNPYILQLLFRFFTVDA